MNAREISENTTVLVLLWNSKIGPSAGTRIGGGNGNGFLFPFHCHFSTADSDLRSQLKVQYQVLFEVRVLYQVQYELPGKNAARTDIDLLFDFTRRCVDEE